jgi:hypothetical protein
MLFAGKLQRTGTLVTRFARLHAREVPEPGTGDHYREGARG